MRVRTFLITIPIAYNQGVITEADTVRYQGVKISTDHGALLIWGNNPDPATREKFSTIVTKIYAPNQWVIAAEEQVS